ncbi:hypothetical protein LR48_Vigan04g175400 [Vigna angularis]|uniref:Uncharacterized protein n=1 Tax=Phaseolus angularis TaxID=3914 RepID=A0A0L9UFT0_PHAAN|nr:hypothetical protein LR48_Vigan04g175400 [Vigna angularis]
MTHNLMLNLTTQFDVDGNDTNVGGLVERLPRSSRQRKRKDIIDDSNYSIDTNVNSFDDLLRERSSIKKPNYILDELEEDLDIFTANMGTLQKTSSKLKEVTLEEEILEMYTSMLSQCIKNRGMLMLIK